MTDHPPTPFYVRLTLLHALKDGWLNGSSKRPTTEALRVAAILGSALPRSVDVYVYPTSAGGVSLEWSDQYGRHEIDVLPDGHLSLLTVEHDEKIRR